MTQAPRKAPPRSEPDDRRPKARAEQDDESPTFKEVVETAATAYYAACKKIARTINRLKDR